MDQNSTKEIALKTMKEIMEKLGKIRPVFHSEDDFKFALAVILKEEFKEGEIRLEIPYSTELKNNTIYLDMRITFKNETYPIELKYKTDKISLRNNNEDFNLREQLAFDFGCYDFLKDVSRIERLIEIKKYKKGFAIFLTNEKLYWEKPNNFNNPNRTINVYDDFRIFEGKNFNGGNSYDWLYNGKTEDERNKAVGKGRINKIKFVNDYIIEWNNYSNVNNNHENGTFKFTIVEV